MRSILPSYCKRLLLVVALVTGLSFRVRAAEEAGHIHCSYYRAVPGDKLEDLKQCATYPKLPSEQLLLDKLEIPEDQPASFGTLIRGFVHPPVSGEYTFAITSDNEGQLWLSRDQTPEQLTLICQVATWSFPLKYDRFPEQKSKPVLLEAGKKYYLEVRHKNGGGDSNCSVGWMPPGGVLEAPIPGKYLSPAAPLPIPPPVVSFDPSKALPSTPGEHKMTAEVEFRGKKIKVPFLVTLPTKFKPDDPKKLKFPGLVFIHDDDPESVDGKIPGMDAEGFRGMGPDKVFKSNPFFAIWYPFVGISPQRPEGATFEQPDTILCVQTALEELTKELPLMADRVYLTGAGSGGTAAWRMALQNPEFYAALAPICGGAVVDPELASKLKNMPVQIITGVKNGFATDCAHKMQDALKPTTKPEPEIYFEMELGNEAIDKTYSETMLYYWLLTQKRSAGKVAPVPPPDAIASPSATLAVKTIAPAPTPTTGPASSVFMLSMTFLGIAGALLSMGVLLRGKRE